MGVRVDRTLELVTSVRARYVYVFQNVEKGQKCRLRGKRAHGTTTEGKKACTWKKAGERRVCFVSKKK